MSHGTASMWKSCKCDTCVHARRAFNRADHKRRTLYGKVTIPPHKAAARVRALVDVGMPGGTIATLAGVSTRTVYNLLEGTAKGIRPHTEAAILAVPYRPAPAGWVPAVGVARTLQALVWEGWTVRSLAVECGWHVQNLQRLLRRREGFVSEGTNSTITNLHHTLAGRQPTGRPGDIAWSRRKARERGWVPLAAWDDPYNPAEEPKGVAA